MVHVAPGGGVVPYGLGLAAPGTPDNSHYQTVALCILQRKGHCAVCPGRHQLPPLGLSGFDSADLPGYAAPHFIGYGLPVTGQYLADGRAAHFQSGGRFVLAPFLLAVGAELFAYLLFLLLCHVLLRFKSCCN